MNINYSSILTKAWNITWKFKVLWFFGFLAMLGGSGGNTGSGGGGWSGWSNPNLSYNYTPADLERSNLPPEWKSFIQSLYQIDLNTWINIAVGVFCCLFLLGLVLWILSIIGRGGLIGGIVSADTAGKVTFREAWDTGIRCFLRLFVIRLLAFGLAILIAVALVLPGIFVGIVTCGLGFIPLICALFIVGIVVNIWFAFMDYAVVTENLGVGEAIGRAWNVLRDHIGPILIFYIILFAVSLAVGLALLIVFIPSGLMIFLSVIPLITEGGILNVPLLIAGLVMLALSILVSMLVQAVFTVWKTSVLTLAYREFGMATPMLTVAAEGQPVVAV